MQHGPFQKKEKVKMFNLCTSCIPNTFIFKTDCGSDAKNHQDPVDIRNVDLPMYLFWSVDHFHSRKTIKCQALIYDRKSASNGCLTSHDGGEQRQHRKSMMYRSCTSMLEPMHITQMARYKREAMRCKPCLCGKHSQSSNSRYTKVKGQD